MKISKNQIVEEFTQVNKIDKEDNSHHPKAEIVR